MGCGWKEVKKVNNFSLRSFLAFSAQRLVLCRNCPDPYILHLSLQKAVGPANWCMGEKLEIVSTFIDFRFFQGGVYCCHLPVGGNDDWLTSDIPLGKPSSHPGSPLDMLPQIFGPVSWAFFSWVGENPLQLGSHCLIWGCEPGSNALDLLWRCQPPLLLDLPNTNHHSLCISCHGQRLHLLSMFRVGFVSNNTKASVMHVVWHCLNCPVPGFLRMQQRESRAFRRYLPGGPALTLTLTSSLHPFPGDPGFLPFNFSWKNNGKPISALEISLLDITVISLQNTCCRLREKWHFDLVSDFANKSSSVWFIRWLQQEQEDTVAPLEALFPDINLEAKSSFHSFTQGWAVPFGAGKG